MAIPFLNNINLRDNQLLNAKLQITGSEPTASQGQIYFSSATGYKKPRVHDGSAWLDLLDTTSIINGTYITSTLTDNVDLTLDLSAADGTAAAATRFLSKDNTWDIPVDYGNWVASDDVTTESVTTGETVKWVGDGTTGVVLTGGVFTITSNDEFVGTVTSVEPSTYISINTTDAAAPVVTAIAAGGAYAAGHNSKLVAYDSTGYVYAKTPESGENSTMIPTTEWVQAKLTTALEFKGGFSANTGAIANTSPVEYLTSNAARVAVEVGDVYVVAAAGDFFGNAATPLTPGDSVIVQTAAVAGASVEGDFIVVQSDTDLATLLTVGIGNVNKSTVATLDGISVAYTAGTASVGLDIVGLPYITNSLTSSDLASIEIPIYNSDIDTPANEKIEIADLIPVMNNAYNDTDTIPIGDLDGTVTHNWNTVNTIVQTMDQHDNTVFCDITRTVNTVTATIAVAQTAATGGIITILVQKIG